MVIKGLRVALWISVLVFLPYYLSLNVDTAERLLRNLDVALYSLLFATVIFSWLLRAARDLIIYRSMCCAITYLDVAILNNQQLVLNYLPLKMGSLNLAAQLRQKYHFSYSGIAGSFLLQQVLVSIIASLCSALAVLIYSDFHRPSSLILLIVFVSLAAVLLVGLLVDIRLPWFPDTVNRRLMAVHAQMRRFSQSTSHFGTSLLFSLGMFALTVARIWLFCLIFQLDIGAAAVILFAGVSQLSLFLAITPAALGIREFFMGALSGVFGLSTATGVVLSLAERIVVLALAIVFLLVATSAGIYRNKHGSEQ